MSRRIDRSWTVFASVENAEHTRCVDFFRRPDQTHGFEEFRRDPEDCGLWTPVAYYSGLSYSTEEDAVLMARVRVTWLIDVSSGCGCCEAIIPVAGSEGQVGGLGLGVGEEGGEGA